MLEFLASPIPPPDHIRKLLVISSAFNGCRNVVASYTAGLHNHALFNLILATTSVLWWREAKNINLLLIDQAAITLVFSNHALHIYHCSSLSQVLVWIAPGASLVTTSYLVRFLTDQQDLAYYIWLAFHICQTHCTVQAVHDFPANCTV